MKNIPVLITLNFMSENWKSDKIYVVDIMYKDGTVVSNSYLNEVDYRQAVLLSNIHDRLTDEECQEILNIAQLNYEEGYSEAEDRCAEDAAGEDY